jgi:hypothetical protein
MAKVPDCALLQSGFDPKRSSILTILVAEFFDVPPLLVGKFSEVPQAGAGASDSSATAILKTAICGMWTLSHRHGSRDETS